MRDINEIIIHCSATRPEWMAKSPVARKVAEIRRWHKDRGWRDIGYHYLIDRDGSVATGRPIEQTGAHVKGRNTGTIGVCLIGGHGSSEKDKFHDHFTEDQQVSLLSLIAELRARFGEVPVTGHNQYAAKACPGFSVPEWLLAEPSAPSAPPATEVPSQGPWAALVAVLLSILGKGKA